MDAEITLARHEWQDALRRLQKMVQGLRRTKSNLILEFDHAELRLSYATVSVSLRGSGSSTGRATTAGKALDVLRLDSAGNTWGDVTISIDNGHIQIGRLTLDCRWSPELDDNTPNQQPDELTVSLSVNELISLAAHILAPLGISHQELETFVTEKFHDAHTKETH